MPVAKLLAAAVALAFVASMVRLRSRSVQRVGGLWMCGLQVVLRRWRRLCGPGTRDCMRARSDVSVGAFRRASP